MDCCQEEKKPLHTVVPFQGIPGKDGDSTGYMTVVPEPSEAYLVRQRWPWPFTLSLIAADGVPASGLTVRRGKTALLLQEAVPTPFNGSVNVAAHETVELHILTEQAGAVLGFQITRTSV